MLLGDDYRHLDARLGANCLLPRPFINGSAPGLRIKDQVFVKFNILLSWHVFKHAFEHSGKYFPVLKPSVLKNMLSTKHIPEDKGPLK